MPFESDAQRKFFNANRTSLEKKGVNVDEWNKSSKGLKLPEHVKNNKTRYYKKAILKKHVGQGGPLFSNIGNGVRNMMGAIGAGVGNAVQGAESGITKGIQGYLGNSPAGQKLGAGLARQNAKPTMNLMIMNKMKKLAPKQSSAPLNKITNRSSGLMNPTARAQQAGAGDASLTAS